jgi:DNA-binding response OmpR family regulator
VLLIEDDVGTRISLARALELEGYFVIRSPNGKDALNVIRTGPKPSLIILDLMLPVMDGWQFRKEQEADPGLATIPVILVSAVEWLDREAQALGIADYLTKPVDMSELVAMVKKYC